MKNLRLTPLLLLLLMLSLSGCSLLASPGPMSVKTGTESMDSILPDPHESPADLAARAEQAFAQGQFRSAQEQFGRLFVLQPDFRGTLAIDGLRGTCQQLGDDCRLIFAKYQFLGDVFRGAFGSRSVWPSQQEADFRSIIQCYNLATMGRFKEAIDVGARTTVAPLPGFAQAALVCVSTSDEIYKRVAEEQARGAARQRWKAEIAAFGVQFDGISSSVAAQDWEQVITLETAYNGRADALQTMAADGTVARAGGEADFAEASSDIAELKRTLSRQKKQLDETRRAVATLQSNPAYLDAAAQFANLSMTEGDQAGQVATLERTLAANQQPGPAQVQLTMQLEAARDRLRETRRNLRDILIRTNDLRKNLKLVPRDRP